MRSNILIAKPLSKKGAFWGEGMRVGVNNAMESSGAVIIHTLPPVEKWLEIKIVRGTS